MSSGPVTLDFSNPEKIVPPTPAPQPDPASTLRQSVSYGASQNPDQYAKLISLHKQTGVPPEVAQGNESEVQHAADVNKLDYPTLAVDHPRTTAWASNPDNAAVSGVDEVQRMAGVEKNAGVMRSLSAFDWYKGKALRPLMEYPITRWALEAAGGAAGLAGNVASFFGLHGSGDTPKNFLQRIESSLEPEDVGLQSNPLDWLAKNVAPMAPAIAASGGTSFIAKALGLSTKAAKVLNGLAIGSLFTADQGGKTYTQMKESGASDNEARLAANKVAAINAPANALFGATELVPFLRNNPVGTSLFLGGTTGASGQVSQNVVTGQPWYKGVIGASLQGAAVQGGMHIGSEMFFDHLGQVIDAADQSKLKQRSPEAFHDAMSTVFEGDPSLKIPVDQFMEYFHSKGVSAQQVAEQLGAKNYAEALVSGGDVEVPMADFLSKLDSEHQQALFPNVAGPDGLTLRQHEEGRAELESWMASGGPEKLRAESAQADAETAATPEYIATKEELRNRYIGAGETPDVAETLATKDANVYANLAKQVGMKPDELMKLYDPQVKAAEAPGVEGQLNQPAYHGSPYKFDKFSLEHMGKGEGAQAYGHGLYFAGDRAVAEYYKNALARMTVDGRDANVHEVNAYSVVQDNGGDFQKARADGKQELESSLLSQRAELQARQKVLDSWSKKAPKIESSGQLYEADIPGDEAMLHWDKPLSEQPEAVRANQELTQLADALGKGIQFSAKKTEGGFRPVATPGPDSPEHLSQRVYPQVLASRDAAVTLAKELFQKNIDGQKLYGELSRKLGSDEAASKRLNELGISGIKYLDGSSRGKGEGNYNYVVFDDKAIKVLKTFYQSNDEGQPRGWFRVKEDGSFEIGRTSIGDLSTFIHEPAHGYLKVIGDLAKREDASETLKGDYSKILDYLGAKDGETLSTDQQEKWARANEQYLREGKAPSEGLKGVFQRFAVWLSSIYKKASDLGVDLTDDIRGVFDRLYAAEEGVNRAESESGPRLFSSPEEAGWTEEQFKKYAESKGLELDQAKSEILSKLNEAALREKTDTWREEEKNVREAMTAEIDRKPEYLAIRALRKGKLPDGTELTLNREELVKQFGEDRVKALQKMHPGLYRNEGGVDTESAAEMLGFDSAGKMLSVLEATPRRSAAIEEATKQYMTAKHGDIRYDGTLLDKAQLAVENEKRAERLHSELQALNRRNNPEYELREAQRELKQHVREQEEAAKAKETKSTAKDMTSLAEGLLKENAKQAAQIEARDRKISDLKQKIADIQTSMREAKNEDRAGTKFAQAIAPIESYREAAKQMVESKAIADLMPNRYLDASRKYARESFDALAKGDYWEAKQAKHKELMNHFLFREATKARETADKIETYAKKLGQMKELRKLGLAGQPYLEQIQALLGRYKFDIGANRSLLEANGPRQESLAQFLNRLKTDENLDLPIDPRLLDEARPNQSYRAVPFSELTSVYDAMRSIDHAAKIVNSVRAEDRRVAIANAAVSLNQKLEESIGKPEVRKSSDRARSFMERVKDVNLDISVLAPEFMFERFDGLSKLGPWHDYFWNRYNDASDHLNRLREMVFPQIMEYRGTKIDRSKKFYIASLDRTLTKDDIISIALNSGNESNLDKQMRGGIQFEKDEAPSQLNEQSLHEILSHLTPDEIKMVNGIWKTIAALKPEAAALERKRTGIEPKWIDPKPLEIANGTLEGGYYPLKYDPRFSAAGEKQSDASTVTQMFTKYASSTTKQGYLKGRTEFAAPLTLDWQATVSRHLDEVATDISHWEFASDAQRLLKNADVKSSIMRNLGNAYYKNLLDWVRYTVNQDTPGREASDNIDRFRRSMRNNVSTAVLGFRVANAVVETGITPLLAVQHVPVESAFKGTMTYMRNPIEATKFATESSDYMKRLDHEIDRDITNALNDLAGKNSLLDDIRRFSIMSRVAIWKIGGVMAWHAGFHDAVNNKGLEGADAVRLADSIYRMTQEAGRPGDLSAVQRNPYMKELTQFIGPSLIQYNNTRRAVMAFKDQGLTQKTIAIGMTALFGNFVNNAMFNVLRGKGPEDKDKWPAWLLARMTLGMADGLPVARDFAGSLEAKILGEQGKDFRLSPVLQVAKDTRDALLSTTHALEGTTAWTKALKQDARAAGGLTGFPATQANITAEYIYDVLSGNYKPEHPWSPITDAFYARTKKH